MTQSIDFYYWPTPNGWKISIMLEEAEIPYNVIPVDISAGDQFKSEFLEISPNNKMPAIADPDGPDGQPISLFESGVILLYLADKTGRFIPSSPRDRYTCGAVADVPNGWRWTHAGTGAPLPPVCT
ncbi:MAG TPA: glutathione S-transferase N-terminal domain-containing protein [Coleofasciculaceae cyanobacterium]